VELRRYWQVVVDRWLVVGVTFLVALVVAAASVYKIPQVMSPYQASFSLAVKPAPDQTSPPYYYSQPYYSYLASEYANDDLISVLETSQFMQGLQSQLANRPGGPPSGSIKGEKAHRVVNVTVSSSSAEGALTLAQTALGDLTAPDARSKYFSMFTDQVESVSVVQPPQITAQPTGRNALLNLAARSLVGLIAGVGLAFLLEYLDDSVRADEVESLLGLPLLGEIPVPGKPGARPARIGAASTNGVYVREKLAK
jgi:capsular polysaccharide biosynthesis protein